MQTEIVKALMGAAGAVGGATYVDDLFSTYIYDGDGSTGRAINNGIDLAGEGGMVWTKRREVTNNPLLQDTVRGGTKYIIPSSNGAEGSAGVNTGFNNNGYTINNAWQSLNNSSGNYVSWTFRKAPGFFDIVTYTGNETARTIAHNLGCVPGCIIVKRLNAVRNWIVYHVSVGNQKYLNLNNTNDANTSSSRWNNTTPTSSVFSVGDSSDVNGNGDEYVAYLFANDEQSFGEDENASVIKCGSYTGNGSSTGPVINLGWEPQYLLIKNADYTSNWRIVDNMRGIVTDGNDAFLTPDLDEAEWSSNKIDLTPTGFKITADYGDVNENNDTIIYVAIRRPDGYCGKPAEAGTDVFAMDVGNSSATIPCFDSNFPVDFAFLTEPDNSSSWLTGSRLTGDKRMFANTNGSEASDSNVVFDSNVGWSKDTNTARQSWMWKRHAGFDVVAFTGVSGTQAINHSLSKVPEMFVVKRRDNTGTWYCYHKGLNGGTNPEQWRVAWNSNAAADQSTATWSNTAPTATQFTTGTNSDTGNVAGAEYQALLFASVKGISHCGTFTGNGSTQTITIPDGGFQPRFLIMKCTSHAVDWQVLDTTRGWGSGNDKYLELNTNAAQYTTIDFGAPTSTGFTLTENAGFNGSGREYIYYAHA